MTRCRKCSAEWAGLAVAHYSVCHQSFSAVSSFDKHRAGSKDGTFSQGECSDPMLRGMVRNRHGYWGQPSDDRFEVVDR